AAAALAGPALALARSGRAPGGQPGLLRPPQPRPAPPPSLSAAAGPPPLLAAAARPARCGPGLRRPSTSPRPPPPVAFAVAVAVAVAVAQSSARHGTQTEETGLDSSARFWR